MSKERIDVLLVKRGLFSSREQARASILAGEVFIRDARVDKAGKTVDEDAPVEVRSKRQRYVSRGGFKMEGAAEAFGLDFSGLTVLDVGASSGGYTDFALQHGAKKVYAVDVGYGQLDWKLRSDERVVVMERTNARHLTPEQLGEKVDRATMDVSFISTTLIFPALYELVKETGDCVSLIKPQFEAGREFVGKRGVVRDPSVHAAVLHKCISAAEETGWRCVDVCYSPIKGPEGNIEYFIRLQKQGERLPDIHERVEPVVEKAHQVLSGGEQEPC